MKVNYMMKKIISISIITTVIFTNCSYIKKEKVKKEMQQYIEYKDLHEHQGTENYEIIKLYDKDFVVKEKLIENKQKIISLLGENEKDISRQKVDFFANVLDDKEYWYRTLQDATLWTGKYYRNWLLNGDNIKKNYLNPITYDEKKDMKSWLKKFSESYNKASYVYESSWNYYMKIDGNWNKFSYDEKLFTPETFDDKVYEKYPTKITPEEIRMIKIPEVFDNLLDNKTLQLVEYVEMDKQKSKGLNPISFSSGYYMFELHLPQGDVLKFRRYGAMGFNADMNIYQIPKELGGSDEVFFIEQLPRQTYPDKSFAGFYAIRPKNYKELPEYKSYSEKEKKN
ncbi:hypothetical protein [Tenacibaculum sp. SDUM215027]|uniref:hypothetical protein n=1 Tax=Tenacibaculum sp. SDUM215027 TaxID=3422596 RepID=UPI003D3192DD